MVVASTAAAKLGPNDRREDAQHFIILEIQPIYTKGVIHSLSHF